MSINVACYGGPWDGQVIRLHDRPLMDTINAMDLDSGEGCVYSVHPLRNYNEWMAYDRSKFDLKEVEFTLRDQPEEVGFALRDHPSVLAYLLEQNLNEMSFQGTIVPGSYIVSGPGPAHEAFDITVSATTLVPVGP